MPVEYPLVVPVEDVARRLRLQQPLDEDDRWIVEQAIRDAQADLEAYLGVAVTPRQYVEQRVVRGADGAWVLGHSPVVEVVSAVPVAGDGWARWHTVTYRAGYDGAADPSMEPVRRYVAAHAVHSGEVQRLLDRLMPEAGRKVTGVTVEGQSVQFASSFQQPGQAGSGAPGALPTLASCERWRRRGVFQRPGRRDLSGPLGWDWC